MHDVACYQTRFNGYSPQQPITDNIKHILNFANF